jgi:hypothetical protein
LSQRLRKRLGSLARERGCREQHEDDRHA